MKLPSFQPRSSGCRCHAPVRTTVLACIVALAAGLSGCSSGDDDVGGDSDKSDHASGDQEANDGSPSPSRTSREEYQRLAYEEDPDKFCSPDDLDGSARAGTLEGTVSFAYLPVFVGSKSDISSELDNEHSSETYVPYSTSKVLLAAVSQDSESVPKSAMTGVKVSQVVEAIKDGQLVSKCGPESNLEVEPVGQTEVKYLHDGVWYTKEWTLWELSGDDFNPLPKDRNTTGFTANITMGEEDVHAVLSNNRARLPSSIAQEGAATRTPDPGMSLIRFYFQHHVWE
ncbi:MULTISPECIES: hypothetical protein [Brevibacterium]|uniref:hypothetical protein n=1 Tax=Brevibacterium TaxID=1696 RepID=UPI0011AF4B08|nr:MULTISPECIES: hypothetical protein [Brevibacterium]KAB1943460.1 hypothetical protein F8227_15685 [Brevibacterium linens ATCC 9172]